MKKYNYHNNEKFFKVIPRLYKCKICDQLTQSSKTCGDCKKKLERLAN